MVLLDFETGLRRGELSGLKWEDINFDEKEITPKRSVVNQNVGDVKTEASKKSIPLDEDLLEELLRWRAETPYAADSDYIFASAKMKGKQPYWMGCAAFFVNMQGFCKLKSRRRRSFSFIFFPD